MFRSLRISHVEFRFSDSEKLGPSRNGRMERNISGIPEFPEKKDNLERLTEILEKIFRKFSVPFDFEPEFSEISVEWNAPFMSWNRRERLGNVQKLKLHLQSVQNYCFSLF